MAPEQKEKLIIGGALGLVALVVIWYLSRASSTAAVSNTVTPSGAGIPGYPNGQPINLGGITVGPSPINLTYNQQPPKDLIQVAPLDDGHLEGGCTCASADACGSGAGQAVTVNKVPQTVIQKASQNLFTYQTKTPATSWLGVGAMAG